MAKAKVTLSALTPPGTNITGLLDYSNLDFENEVQIFRGGLLLWNANVPAAGVEAYPGSNPATGDIRLGSTQPDGEIDEEIAMVVTPMDVRVSVAPNYDPATHDFTCHVYAEQGGNLITAPTYADLILKSGPVDVVYAFPTSSTPTPDGVFTFIHPSLTLVKGAVYFLCVSMVVGGTTYDVRRTCVLC